MDQSFTGEIIEWRGPAPYYFVPVPEEDGEALRAVALSASYGWGMLPIRARLGSTEWKTSLWPKDGGYLLPLKDAVRKPKGLDAGDTVEIRLTFEPPTRPPKPPHEQPPERALQQAGDQAPRRTPKQARQRAQEQVPEQVLEQGREQAPRRAPEQARRQARKQVPERVLEPRREPVLRRAPEQGRRDRVAGQGVAGRASVGRAAGARETVSAERLTVVPANRATAGDLRAVFGERGDSARCWCQRFRMLPKESWASEGPEELAARLRDQTGCGDPQAETTSGLIAYLDGEPVGWCAVAPRADHPRLLRDFRVPWLDRTEDKADPTVWAVTCFVTRVGYRRRGISRILARAAADFARDRGARAVEGYPDLVDGGYVGTLATFADAGYSEVSRPGNRRAVLRIDF
jgi:GNAT superfamily N-acetyltransferase